MLCWHYPHYHGSAWKPGSAIRFGDNKLVVHYEDDRVELYNLKDDPGETDDLSSDKPKEVRQLRKKLDRWLKLEGAQMPVINPEYIWQ
jgi:hypothetical protein